jgi:putative methyltransferase (TIGR04325 family)
VSQLQPVWEGVYSTWDEAAANAVGGGFSAERWITQIVAQLSEYRAQLASGAYVPPPRPSTLPALCAMTRAQSVVDYGGSSGWTWDYMRAAMPDNPVKRYHIVENGDLVRHFRSHAVHDDPVSYSTASEFASHADVLYSNSVLQYSPDNSEFLSLCERAEPRYVLLDDLFAGPFPTFYSIQIYYEHRIAHRFLDFGELRGQLEARGYRLALDQPYLSPIRGVVGAKPMDNFPPDHRLGYARTACFERAGAQPVRR